MSDRLAERVAGLASLDRPALMAQWADAFGRPTPKRMSRDLLLRSLAYHLQERAEGGLSKAALRRLAALSDPNGGGNRPRKPAASRLRPGTRLVREWRGEVHQVTVCDDCFDHGGTRYTSLSQIARAITGTRWSGPLFFGLRRPGKQTGTSTDAV